MAMVMEYSTKQLTYETGMLPAISGLARIADSSGENLYLYGLWISGSYTSTSSPIGQCPVVVVGIES